MNKAFWKNKKVVVTGHTGFKGAWLSLWLHEMGARVVGYALPPEHPDALFRLAQVDQMVHSIMGDVRDYNRLYTVIRDEDPDIVFHMAAQPLVKESYLHPRTTYDVNLMGSVHLLEAIRLRSGRKNLAVVMVTTDKTYVNHDWLWGYREDDRLGGYDPYSSSKACSELAISSYRDSFFPASHYVKHGVGLASARAGNVIGGGDWATNRLVPDSIRAYLKQETLWIRHPEAIRPWQHVLEPLAGYLQLAEKLYIDGAAYASAWNFGPEDRDCATVRQIIEMLKKRGMHTLMYRLDHAEQPHEARTLKLDCSKAKTVLGWRPLWSVSEAIDSIIAWTKAYEHRQDIKQLCLEQIQSYQHAQDQL